ncbi:hypothetical protein HMI54_011489 [Coelomomyces lativittatus]|nr:hypothetical protein HMI54_011489 [Coelomomyces lativittatus]
MYTRGLCLVVNSSRGHHIVHYLPDTATTTTTTTINNNHINPTNAHTNINNNLCFPHPSDSPPSQPLVSIPTYSTTPFHPHPNAWSRQSDVSTSIPMLTPQNPTHAWVPWPTTFPEKTFLPQLQTLHEEDPPPPFQPSTLGLHPSSNLGPSPSLHTPAYANLPFTSSSSSSTLSSNSTSSSNGPTTNAHHTESFSNASHLLPSTQAHSSRVSTLSSSSSSSSSATLTTSNTPEMHGSCVTPHSSTPSHSNPTSSSSSTSTSSSVSSVSFPLPPPPPLPPLISATSSSASLSPLIHPLSSSLSPPTTTAPPLPPSTSHSGPSSYTHFLGMDPYLLSDFLSPKLSHCDKRFELQLNDLVFLGLPVSLTGQKLAQREIHFPIAPYYQHRIARYLNPSSSSSSSSSSSNSSKRWRRIHVHVR